MPNDETELLHPRAIVWRMVIEIFKKGHALRFPGRHNLGADLEVYFVFGAATVFIADRKPVRPSTIARYVRIPRETVRRHLATLRERGLLERQNCTFTFGRRGKESPAADAFVDAVVNAASKLI